MSNPPDDLSRIVPPTSNPPQQPDNATSEQHRQEAKKRATLKSKEQIEYAWLLLEQELTLQRNQHAVQAKTATERLTSSLQKNAELATRYEILRDQTGFGTLFNVLGSLCLAVASFSPDVSSSFLTQYKWPIFILGCALIVAGLLFSSTSWYSLWKHPARFPQKESE